MTLSLFGVKGHDCWPVKAMCAAGDRTEDSLMFDPGAPSREISFTTALSVSCGASMLCSKVSSSLIES